MKVISILILLLLLSVTSAYAQQRKFNSITRSLETESTTEIQEEPVEVKVSKKQIIMSVIATAGITVCEQFRRCSNVLNIIRNIFVPSQINTVPKQNFNRSTRRSIIPMRY